MTSCLYVCRHYIQPALTYGTRPKKRGREKKLTQLGRRLVGLGDRFYIEAEKIPTHGHPIKIENGDPGRVKKAPRCFSKTLD